MNIFGSIYVDVFQMQYVIYIYLFRNTVELFRKQRGWIPWIERKAEHFRDGLIGRPFNSLTFYIRYSIQTLYTYTYLCIVYYYYTDTYMFTVVCTQTDTYVQTLQQIDRDLITAYIVAASTISIMAMEAVDDAIRLLDSIISRLREPRIISERPLPVQVLFSFHSSLTLIVLPIFLPRSYKYILRSSSFISL